MTWLRIRWSHMMLKEMNWGRHAIPSNAIYQVALSTLLSSMSFPRSSSCCYNWQHQRQPSQNGQVRFLPSWLMCHVVLWLETVLWSLCSDWLQILEGNQLRQRWNTVIIWESWVWTNSCVHLSKHKTWEIYHLTQCWEGASQWNLPNITAQLQHRVLYIFSCTLNFTYINLSCILYLAEI